MKTHIRLSKGVEWWSEGLVHSGWSEGPLAYYYYLDSLDLGISLMFDKIKFSIMNYCIFFF